VKFYLISDTHFNHGKIATYCDRPENVTEILARNWSNTVQSTDTVIHLGDVFIGRSEGWDHIRARLTGRKILIRGNHDRQRSLSWWMSHGFDFACDSMIFRSCWLTHEPAGSLPSGCELNLHGHLHNIWHGFAPNAGAEKDATEQRRLHNTWQRLFSVEYTNYMPIEFDKFVSHPNKYQARGPRA
jgi:calcineurin-like phosphoesterase family protein